MNIKTTLPGLAASALLFLNLIATPAFGQNSSNESVTDRTKATVQSATDSVQSAGNAAADNFKALWGRINESRLKNRTLDELLAYVIIGVMVGAVAGLFTSLKCSGMGKVGRLTLGLAGAILGGMIVRVTQVDFGWGPVLIRFEEVLFALMGAILLTVVIRFFQSKSKKPEVKP